MPKSSPPRGSPARRRRTLILSPHTAKKRDAAEDSLLLVNEDEEEKRAHRKSLALQSFQKTPAVLSSPRLSSKKAVLTPLSGPRFNSDQLKQHYADCLKLSTENKINAKNAFGLHLLEYIDTILQEKSDNFQVVGCTIDAGAKIYAGRVDAVHGDILKMLGSMGNAENDNNNDQEDAEDVDDHKKKDKKKKKKITLCEGRTIEKNLANIRNQTYDLSFDVDPLIHITTRQSDEQCTASLISYNIFMRDDSLLFDSTSVHQADNEERPPAPQFNASHMESFLPDILNIDRPIFPTFDGFRFNNWVCTEEKSFYEPAPSQPDTQDSEPQIEPFIPGIEDMVEDEDEVEFGGPGDSSGDEAAPTKLPDKMTIDDLTLALQPTEYGYFNPQLAHMWAGPGHWKLKPSQTKANGEKKERKKKTAITHTFETSEDDLFKHFIKSRAKTTLADETIRTNRTSNNTLPVDINYLESNLRKLAMMPLWRGAITPSDMIVSSGQSTDQWYNYENAHDVSNYCPNTAQSDDDDDVGVAGPDFSLGSPGGVDPIGDLELIEAAPRIERIDIQYAKQAKKIDVKKLKKVMWSNIVANSANCNSENIEPSKDVTEDKKSDSIRFSDIYKKIPKQVSSTMAENLSVPIAFACLLHLANEHGLQLNGNDELSDVQIIQPS